VTSMHIRTLELTDSRGVKAFIRFPRKLYADNPLWIPMLERDERELFNPDHNPSFADAEVRLFLAEEEGRILARVAAILSHTANRKYGTRNLRFGWFESENRPDAVEALFLEVEKWGRERGMESLTGTMGFTDLDPEGILIDGFDQVPTLASNYNPPYYAALMEQAGFEKEIDYVEFRVRTPENHVIPDKLLSLCDRIRLRGRFHVLRFKNRREVLRHGVELLTLLDESFDEVYGSVPLTREQMEYYLKRYAFCAHPDLIIAVVDENKDMVGFMVAMPSLTRGFQRAGGRLLPLGWWHILRSRQARHTLDFYLAGVKKKYRGTGIDLLMLIEIARTAMDMGFVYSESNLELETNFKIHAMWKYFNPVQHKRRRIYRRRIAFD